MRNFVVYICNIYGSCQVKVLHMVFVKRLGSLLCNILELVESEVQTINTVIRVCSAC